MPQPLRLSDHQLDIVYRADPDDCGAFLEDVAEQLRHCEIGDGAVSRAAREAQRHFLHPPEDTGLQHAPKYQRRERRP
jgi:hypothetical protein